MAEPGIIDVDHRGKACGEALRQLPGALLNWGEPSVANSGVRRTTLEFGDVEWTGWRGEAYYVELKLARDFVNSIKSGHMQDQEMVLAELGGVSKVFVIGSVLPSANKGQVVVSDGATGFLGARTTEENFPYSGYINYMVHLQELGIDVVKVDSLDYIGYALAAAYARSLRAPRGDRIVKRRMVSVSPSANAVKALYPDLRLDVRACETLAQVAGVKLGTSWLEDLKEKNGGTLRVRDVVEALPGVGRPTIKRLFGV